MTGDTQPDLDSLTASAHDGQQRGHEATLVALTQAISTRLLSVGLELNFMLTQVVDDPAEPRLRRAIDDLDKALNDLRHLMLALPGVIPGAHQDGIRPDGAH